MIMAKIPCPIKEPCLDDANPFVNLSAEAPDVNHFYAYGSGPGSISNGRTTGPGAAGPKPGGNWASSTCESENGPITCVATTQEEAILCVNRLAQQCTRLPGTPPGLPSTPSGDPLFSNTLQQCSAICSDGSPFVFQVAAGTFVASSQILADREAQTYACRQASILKLCFGPLSNSSGCVGQSFSATTTAVGGTGFSFSITNGSLPPGITMSASGSTVLFSGTPTTPGNYSFSLRVTNSRGNFMVKSFTIRIIGFTNTSPATFTQNTAYSFQFMATGGTAPYSFSIVAGSLPAGLAMTAAGLVSGTPTGTTASSASVKVTDATGASCSQSYTFSPSAAKSGWMICNWTDVRPLLTMTSEPDCETSINPEWDGIFDLSDFRRVGIDCHVDPDWPFYYFINQSINGKAVAPSDCAFYPNPPFAVCWQNQCCYTVLGYDPIFQVWYLEILCGCTEDTWYGQINSTDPTNPAGTYPLSNGSSTEPVNIEIRHTGYTCCADVGTVVGATYSGPQPSQIRVSDYSNFLAALGPCPLCDASANPEWDGTFTVSYAPDNANLEYYPTGTLPPPGILRPLIPALNIAAHKISNGVAASSFIQVRFRPNIGWQIQLICIATGEPGNQSLMWQGLKGVGADATGTYVRNGGVSTTPDCLHIQSY